MTVRTILALGQSNIAGLPGAAAGGSFFIDAGVSVWNNAARRSDLLELGTAFVAPAMNANPFDGNNNMIAHAASIMAALSGDAFRILLSAMPGTIASTWIDESGVAQQQYERMAAVLAAASVIAADYLFWVQGESDSLAGVESGYADTFELLRTRLQSDGYIGAATPIVVADMPPNYVSMVPVLEAIVTADPSRMAFALIGSLPTSDGSHYIGSAMPVAGRRIVEALSGVDHSFIEVWPNG